VRVLLDLRCLETASALRGIGRYAHELARCLPGVAPAGWEFFGLSWSGVGESLGIGDVRYPGPRRGIGVADRWILPGLLRRASIDVYHATAYALPSTGAPPTALVLTVHDLVADLYPGALALRHRLAFRRTFHSTAAADRVITVSDATRRDLLARYSIDPAQVTTVPNGVSATFRAPAEADRPSGLPVPFLLYVGGLDRLKNVPFLLDVLDRIRARAPEVHLVVAGEEGARRHAFEQAAAARGLSTRVHAVGFLPDPQLAAAYAEALAFVFPSLHEGFGLPPLEAMAAGCPVVSSPAGALAEVLDGAAILRDPADAPGWAEALLSLLQDPGRREAIARAGADRARGFTWERTARQTLGVYEEAARKAARG
jgi:glycosyltransferase involved in cell wall biosynthesis